MKVQNNYRNGKVHILSEKCSTCVFRKGNLMHLSAGRLSEMVRGAIDNGSVITCHQTLDYGEYVVPGNAVCRGYFDHHADKVYLLQLAINEEMIEWQNPPTEKKG